MIFVVDNIYVASSCPKRLEPLAAEIRKSIHHAFVEKEEMERFFDTVQQNLQKEVPGKSMKRVTSMFQRMEPRFIRKSS